MNYYIKRLIKCGYSQQDASKLCAFIIEKDGIFKLIAYLETLENKNVDRIQSKSRTT